MDALTTAIIFTGMAAIWIGAAALMLHAVYALDRRSDRRRNAR